MVFRKAIIQVYSGNEPFGFDDFVRGTLRLFNYAIDHNIDVKINVSGAEFEAYMIVNNYSYDTTHIKPKLYFMNIDQELLIQDLDNFMNTSDPIFVVTSNVWMDRTDIYNSSYVNFDALVRYKETLYHAAEQRVLDNLLYRPQSDNLLYGYSIIYLNRDEFKFQVTTRQLASLANQIRVSMDMNKDIMLFSNSIQLRKILSQYIEMNSAAVQRIDDSDIDIGPTHSIPTIFDLMVDFIILLRAKKIYRYSEFTQETGHNIKFTEEFRLQQQGLITRPQTNIYDAAFDINNIIGNLELTLVPLYYQVYSIAGFGGVGQDASGNSVMDTPSGVVVDASGNVFFSDTMHHCIRRLDTSGNVLMYAGTGIAGYKDGGPSNAQFNQPTAMAIDSRGNIYVADTFNNAIRIIEKNFEYDPSGNLIGFYGIVSTFIGNGFNNSDPTVASGTGTGVFLKRPKGVAVDPSGNVYISDTGHHRICKVPSGGYLVTLAGGATLDGPLSYKYGMTDGEATNATFNGPTGICVDMKGNVFVADTLNSLIRRITPTGKVSTVAGNGQPFYKEGRKGQASFNYPTGICVDLHNVLYVADTGNNVIRRITNEGNVVPVVGSPVQKSGALDGYGSMDPRRAQVPFSNRATFNAPAAIFVGHHRVLYVADALNNKIRRIIPTFSTPTNIRPVAMQALRITHAPGVAYTLGPTLSAPPPPPNTVVYGHQRGSRR
jgi:sugar lactone lactonase YvrE